MIHSIALAQMLLHNSVQAETSKLSGHVRNFMMISPMLFRWRNKSIESYRRWAHRLRKWLVAYSTASHYLNQCLINWTDRHKIQWFFCLFFVLFCFIKYKNKNSSTKIHLKMSPAKWRPFWSMAPWRDDLKWGNGKILNPFIQVV